jgi:hypothetical protein
MHLLQAALEYFCAVTFLVLVLLCLIPAGCGRGPTISQTTNNPKTD